MTKTIIKNNTQKIIIRYFFFKRVSNVSKNIFGFSSKINFSFILFLLYYINSIYYFKFLVSIRIIFYLKKSKTKKFYSTNSLIKSSLFFLYMLFILSKSKFSIVMMKL